MWFVDPQPHPHTLARDQVAHQLLSTHSVPFPGAALPFPPGVSISPATESGVGGQDTEFSVQKRGLRYMLVVLSTECGSQPLAKRKSQDLVSLGMLDLRGWLLVTQHPILCVGPSGHSTGTC